ERQAKALTQGAADVESKHINRSLSSLQDVFAALLAKEKHIPFRNSKLTQLLQDSLAGNSKVPL
ncbi:kinesin motor domain-containing protein, partial [Baffinella frigidus]